MAEFRHVLDGALPTLEDLQRQQLASEVESGVLTPTAALQRGNSWIGSPDVFQRTQSIAQGGQAEASDTWDSVRSQLRCVVCSQVFPSLHQLSLHSNFSETHLHNMQRYRELQGSQDAEIRNVLLYRGCKNFYWTGDKLMVEIWLGGDDMCVILREDGQTDVMREVHLQLHEVLGLLPDAPRSPTLKAGLTPTQRELLQESDVRDRVVSLLLERVQQVTRRDGTHSCTLWGLEGDPGAPHPEETAAAQDAILAYRASSIDPGTDPTHPKLKSADEAIAVIRDGATVTIGGFVGSGYPESLVLALAALYSDAQCPRDIRLVYGVGQGDTRGRGLDVLAALPGLVRHVVCSHSGVAPGLQRAFHHNTIAAHNIPLGVLSQLFRDSAAGKVGTLSPVGLGTFVDPREGGCALNPLATELTPVVDVLNVRGEELLFFDRLDIDVALLRGTMADSAGNISIKGEAVTLDVLHQAMAAHNNGGHVIVQVQQVIQEGLLSSRDVWIPGVLVDTVVVASDPRHHWQTLVSPTFDASLAGQQRIPLNTLPPLDLNHRTVIARRAALELRRGDCVNLGLGIPEHVASVLASSGCIDGVCLTAEAGVIGGVPASGLRFGTAYNTDAIVPTSTLFDFYGGGGLDVACLGMAQVDPEGNVNVGRFSGLFPGVGGFIDITQSAKRLIFLGTHTAGGLKVLVGGGVLGIHHEGRNGKFIPQVELVTFSGRYANQRTPPVMYITERAVFVLRSDGLHLTEIAPGVDLQRDVLDLMAFKPIVDHPLTTMDASIFSEDFCVTLPTRTNNT